jgi:hypothetical protein
MSTSDRMVALEAAVATAVMLGIVAVVSPGDVWMRGTGLHPIWLPVIALAARYAHRGLFPALLLGCGGLIALCAAHGQSISGFEARAESPADLIALATAVVVAWIAMLHEGRHGRAQRKLAEITEQHRQADEQLRALHESLGYLRGRHDRLDVSISLWRSLAARLERGDAVGAARAVLELCEIRTGAQAGLVLLRDGHHLSTLGARGGWSTEPKDCDADATVRAAITSRRVTPAAPGATEADSDIAVPVVDDAAGVVAGVIALRGISTSSLRAADMRDLAVLAQWFAPALARHNNAAIQRRRTSQVLS